jgi:hypothetical protein
VRLDLAQADDARRFAMDGSDAVLRKYDDYSRRLQEALLQPAGQPASLQEQVRRSSHLAAHPHLPDGAPEGVWGGVGWGGVGWGGVGWGGVGWGGAAGMLLEGSCLPPPAAPMWRPGAGRRLQQRPGGRPGGHLPAATCRPRCPALPHPTALFPTPTGRW